MSFCSDIKSEMSEIRVSQCCAGALTYGMLLFGRSFDINKILIQSENIDVVRLYSDLIKNNYGIQVKVTAGNSKNVNYLAEVLSCQKLQGGFQGKKLTSCRRTETDFVKTLYCGKHICAAK